FSESSAACLTPPRAWPRRALVPTAMPLPLVCGFLFVLDFEAWLMRLQAPVLPSLTALDGLYWGDNVVWVWGGGEASSQALFYDAIGRRREDFGRAGYVVASTDPAQVRARWPWIEILDARKGAPLTSPRSLLEAIRAFSVQARRPLLLFDSLEPLCSRW